MAFDKVKKAEDREKLIAALNHIVGETRGPAGRSMVPQNVVKDLMKHEPTFFKTQGDPDPMGNIAVFATSAGVAASTGEVPSEAPAKPTYTIEKGIVRPEPKRGGGAKTEQFPFATMELGDSFFIQATEAKPNPAKNLASTITTANRRYAAVYPAKKGKNPHPQAGQSTGKDGRKFAVSPRNTEAHGEQGARVWRVA